MNIQIGKHVLGVDKPVFIVAELSANHGGDLSRAIDLIHAAKRAGADAVKLQTYTPDTITLNCSRPDFMLPKDSAWSDHFNLYNLYSKAYTPWEWHERLFYEARQIDLEIFSSPFDHSAVDLLEQLNAPAYKIASPEITDIPLIKRVAQTGKPVILSTGMANFGDIQLAVNTLRLHGCEKFIILKCISSYPASHSSYNLATIPHMAKVFNCLTGLSDHSPGIAAPVTATVLGAAMIEKHLTSEHDDETVDSFFSADVSEFTLMVQSVRNAAESIGEVNYDFSTESIGNLWARRSLYVLKDLEAGEVISSEHIKSVRPGHGLHPKFYDDLIGSRTRVPLKFGDRIREDDIEWKRSRK